jgi:hypothetical protein
MCTKPPDFGGQVGCPPLPGLAPSARKDDACLTRLPAAGRIHPNRTLEAVGSIPISSTGTTSERSVISWPFTPRGRGYQTAWPRRASWLRTHARFKRNIP